MSYKEKIKELMKCNDLALIRWKAINNFRMARKFIPMSSLRFEALLINNGECRYISAAPILTPGHDHRPRIKLATEGLVEVLTGKRKGILIPLSQLREDEEAAEAKYCYNTLLTDDITDKVLIKSVMSLGASPSIAPEQGHPPIAMIKPEFFRLSQSIEVIEPIYSREVISAVGADPSSSPEEVKASFRENDHPLKFDIINEDGRKTGVAVRNDVVRRGGCCAAHFAGFSSTGNKTQAYERSARAIIEELQQWGITLNPS